MKNLIKIAALSLLLLSSLVSAETVNTAVIYTQDKPAVMVTPDKAEFTIKLKSNATTGYSWFLRDYDKNLIEPVSHHYQRAISQLAGAPAFEFWTFRVKPQGFIVPQVTYIRFVYSRPWENAPQTNQQVEFKVSTLALTPNSPVTHTP